MTEAIVQEGSGDNRILQKTVIQDSQPSLLEMKCIHASGPSETVWFGESRTESIKSVRKLFVRAIEASELGSSSLSKEQLLTEKQVLYLMMRGYSVCSAPAPHLGTDWCQLDGRNLSARHPHGDCPIAAHDLLCCS